jgi:hypothetical protein
VEHKKFYGFSSKVKKRSLLKRIFYIMVACVSQLTISSFLEAIYGRLKIFLIENFKKGRRSELFSKLFCDFIIFMTHFSIFDFFLLATP